MNGRYHRQDPATGIDDYSDVLHPEDASFFDGTTTDPDKTPVNRSAPPPRPARESAQSGDGRPQRRRLHFMDPTPQGSMGHLLDEVIRDAQENGAFWWREKNRMQVYRQAFKELQAQVMRRMKNAERFDERTGSLRLAVVGRLVLMLLDMETRGER